MGFTKTFNHRKYAHKSIAGIVKNQAWIKQLDEETLFALRSRRGDGSAFSAAIGRGTRGNRMKSKGKSEKVTLPLMAQIQDDLR